MDALAWIPANAAMRRRADALVRARVSYDTTVWLRNDYWAGAI
jgi:hypothetical protein